MQHMSTDGEDSELNVAGAPELTALGKRLELLRLDRRISKRILAQRAGTSRQQLWRVMTGKSELTSSLCARLAEVLEVDSRLLRDTTLNVVDGTARHPARPMLHARGSAESAGPSLRLHPPVYPDGPFTGTLSEFISAPHGLARTLDTLPNTEDGRRLKRMLLDAIEDIAIARALKLPQTIFDLRRAVVNADD
jgi:transcriptional regulator with XRE-family HTH domain